MKIISWDVGIKNLAYCIIELNSDNTKKILHWNIINLIPENEHCFIKTCKKLMHTVNNNNKNSNEQAIKMLNSISSKDSSTLCHCFFTLKCSTFELSISV